MDPTSSLVSPSAQAMTSTETPNETVRALWVVAAAAVLIPVLLFGGAALEDRSAVLRRAEHDGRKTVALLHEQAANLLSGHEIILDTIVERVRGHDWETLKRPRICSVTWKVWITALTMRRQYCWST